VTATATAGWVPLTDRPLSRMVCMPRSPRLANLGLDFVRGAGGECGLKRSPTDCHFGGVYSVQSSSVNLESITLRDHIIVRPKRCGTWEVSPIQRMGGSSIHRYASGLYRIESAMWHGPPPILLLSRGDSETCAPGRSLGNAFLDKTCRDRKPIFNFSLLLFFSTLSTNYVHKSQDSTQKATPNKIKSNVPPPPTAGQ
jgi:hypothetical protein